MGIFISVPKTIECVVSAVIFAALFSATYIRPLGILQSLGYSGKKLFVWAKKKNNAFFMRETLLFMLCALAYAVISLCFSFAGQWAAVIGLAAYALFFILYVYSDKKLALRTKAHFTPRLKGLYVVVFFITAVFVYMAFTLLNFADVLLNNGVFNLLRYLPLSLFALLHLPLLALGNLIDKIYEIPHNKKFIGAAAKKLKASHVITVGITGSYGKTSVKNMLYAMLSKKYRVIATPASFNTPMGLALTINNSDLDACDVFIAEMGARHTGDIAELCAVCPPDYSVITGICPQHLQTFITEEAIVSAKGEILSSTKETAVISPDCYDKFSAYSCKKAEAGCVSSINADCNGTDFTLTLGDKSVRVHTKLLGEHAAKNFGIAASLAHIMGVTIEDIASAIESADYIEHRLQLTQSNGVNIIDDGYNSNPAGAAAALEVLKTFGGRKIVVTPGLVELGILEEKENYELGAKLVGFDYVILVGDTLIAPVKRGYSEGGGDMSLIFTCPDLISAQNALKGILTKGDAVLFLNDLPDTY